MRKVYILGACRTPIGKFGGTLANVSAADLGATVIKEAVARAGLTPEQVLGLVSGVTSLLITVLQISQFFLWQIICAVAE